MLLKKYLALILLLLFPVLSVQASGRYKIKYEATIIYTEPDGTKIVLPEIKGKVWMRVSDQACLIRVGGWESNIIHRCLIEASEKGLAPNKVELSDDTMVTALLESLKFLLDKKFNYALKIFNKANIYVNDRLMSSRPLNQSTEGSLILDFNKPTRLTLEHMDLKNKIKVEVRFKELRRTLKKKF